jgi:lysozyme
MGYNLTGLDVSHYQMKLDWAKVKAANVQFMFAKCTEGTAYKDDMYVRNIQQAKAQGIITGSYHFFHPKQSPGLQALWYYECAKFALPDLPPVIDIEVDDNVAPNIVHANATIFLYKVNELFGKIPIVYTTAGLAHKWGFDKELEVAYPFWVAAYSNTEPTVKHTFWQFTDKYEIAGIGKVDGDYYKGTIDDLNKLAQKQPIQHPVYSNGIVVGYSE